MNKHAFASVAAGTLLGVAGIAGAAEPMQLSEAQMDGISAGSQYSEAFGAASALSGKVAVKVSSTATSYGAIQSTRASAFSLAIGPGSSATAGATSRR